MSRLMCKTLEVDRQEKGSPLQSKLNAFTNGKNIADIVSITVAPGSTDRVTLLYLAEDKDASTTHERIYFKTFLEANTQQVKAKDSEGNETTRESANVLQSKINAFTGGDRVKEILRTAVAPDGDSTLVVIAHTKEPGEDDEDDQTSDEVAETAGAAA